MEVEEAEFEELIRIALMSTLPILKSKVELFSKPKDSWLKEKVEKLENQLAGKKNQLKQLEGKSKSQKSELSKQASKLQQRKSELSNKVKVFRRLFESAKDQVINKDSNC